jgi:hypothetical protein
MNRDAQGVVDVESTARTGMRGPVILVEVQEEAIATTDLLIQAVNCRIQDVVDVRPIRG